MNSLEEFRQNFERCQKSIALAEPVLRKHRMRLGIENHKGWRSAEQAAWLKRVEQRVGGRAFRFRQQRGAVRRARATMRNLLPYTFACHIKDMAVEPYEDGFLLSEVPLGEGFLDIKGMVATLRQKDPKMPFDLEMITRDPLKIPVFTDKYWVTFDDTYSPLPGRDFAKIVKLVHENQPEEPASANQRNESGSAVETRGRVHFEIHRVRAPVPGMRLLLVRRVALACLALAVCLPAATHDPWLKITSANFELYTTANERYWPRPHTPLRTGSELLPASLRQPPAGEPPGAHHRLPQRKGVSALPAQRVRHGVLPTRRVPRFHRDQLRLQRALSGGGA